jgi:hypothetical protein
MRSWRSTNNRSSDTGGPRYGGTKGLRAFLLLNDWELTFNEDEFVELVLSVAVGQLAKPGLIRIFESGCKPLEEA